jgi:predicted 3-demethylubiquinone-9 3-methyltransferase (glyoxalase superfamily)
MRRKNNMQKIIPNLWFNKNAEEAVQFYLTVFPEGRIVTTNYYPKEGLADFQKEFAGEILTIEFELFGQHFVAINAGPEFAFNESVSFLINCKDQAEIDYYWGKLISNGGQESVCGWLKDKYGLSWQVAPGKIDKLVQNPKAFAKMMQMKKIIIADLETEGD